MSENANDLIERMERETGQRIDDDSGDNFAMAGLFGALAREMGGSQHTERDDVVAGALIRHQMTPGYRAEQIGKKMMAAMLAGGMSPDELKAIISG